MSASATRGPTQDAPRLIPAVRPAAMRTPVGPSLADAGCDPRANRAAGREELGARPAATASNRRGRRQRPQAQYRRRPARRLRTTPPGCRSRRAYGQRGQVGSASGRGKRRLGAAVAASTWPSRKPAVLPEVITHNIMILAPPKVST